MVEMAKLTQQIIEKQISYSKEDVFRCMLYLESIRSSFPEAQVDLDCLNKRLDEISC